MRVQADEASNTKCLRIVESEREFDHVNADAVMAVIGRHINFNVEALDTFDVKGWKSLHYDLLVVCAAIEFADRHWKRPLKWRRNFDVTIAVVDLKVWQKRQVVQSLHSALRHLTGDSWQFTFLQAKNPPPIGSRQIPLEFDTPKAFAIAYSDGLDSRAVSALSGHEDEGIRIRVDRNRRHRNGDSFFTHVPFEVSGYRGNESSFRSRAFKFAAVTSIAAHLSKVSRIIVPESGQGALGPVLLPLHNVYADYRNHPTFFRKMELFIKALFSFRLKFEQPRLWSTKGQTLKAFLRLAGKSGENLTDTTSCWQVRRVVNVRGRKQCGLCAACLLRRLSLHAAGIEEASETYVVSNLHASDLNDALSVIPQKVDRNIMIEYGSVGVRHLQHLAEMSTLTDNALRSHVSQIAIATNETNEVTLRNLRMMLIAHAEEWRNFLNEHGTRSFLKSWMDGGRHG